MEQWFLGVAELDAWLVDTVLLGTDHTRRWLSDLVLIKSLLIRVIEMDKGKMIGGMSDKG